MNFLGAPSVTISGLLNIIPSALFPNKVAYMVYVGDIYPLSESPAGATHFFLNFNGGLGIFLSILLFYVLGRVLERTRYELRSKELGAKVIYCFVTANLFFTLFRDPFNVSVIKNILELSVIVPWIITWIGNKTLYRSSGYLYYNYTHSKEAIRLSDEESVS